MLQPMVRRVALGAMQAALVAAGIFAIMLLFSRPAHAATAALSSPDVNATTGWPDRGVPDYLGRQLDGPPVIALPPARPGRAGHDHGHPVAKTLAPVTSTAAPVVTRSPRPWLRSAAAAAPVVSTTVKTLGAGHQRGGPRRQRHRQDPWHRVRTVTPVVTTVAKTVAPVARDGRPRSSPRRSRPWPRSPAVTPVVTTVVKTLAPVTERGDPSRRPRSQDAGARHPHADPGRHHRRQDGGPGHPDGGPGRRPPVASRRWRRSPGR